MEFWLHTVLVLAVSAVTVLGRPNGAPMAACSNLMPAHTNSTNTANGSVPFYVNTSNIGSYYTPGRTYTIVLYANNTNFRGFIIQARTMADGSPVGQFTTENSTDQRVECTDDTAVTHRNASEKTMVGLYWIAPMGGTGAIVFRYAFVYRYVPGSINVFWAGLETDMIGEAVINATTTSIATVTATVTPTVTTTPGGGGDGSSGLVAGTMLILLLSAIITLIN